MRSNDGDKCSVQNNGGLVPDITCKVAHPARGQLNMENELFSLSAFAPENLVSRDGFGSSVPRQPAHLHTLAESGAHFPLSRLDVVLAYEIPPIQYYLYVRQTAPVAAESRAIQENCAIYFYDFLGFNGPLTAAAACRTTD